VVSASHGPNPDVALWVFVEIGHRLRNRRTTLIIVTALQALRHDLAVAADPERAVTTRWYFKMGPDGYGEGDDALGVRVPEQRRLARRYWQSLSLEDMDRLLTEGIHEERLTALFVLTHHFASGRPGQRQAVAELVLSRTDRINNWDLVDAIAPSVVGPWLQHRDRSVLDRLAGSSSVWERRLAMVSTLTFIREDDFTWTFRLADTLLDDPHDLVRKAVGWMLREVGNRDRTAEQEFLATRYSRMPRAMLRYAIEKFPSPLREEYLSGAISSPGSRPVETSPT
jgi:3-methyladenine DNA glycosylase AlkD